MIKVTWKQVLDDAFKDAIMTLANAHQMDKAVSYRAGKLCYSCDGQMKYIREARQNLLKGYVELGDDGVPKLDEKKQPIFNSPTAQEEFKTAYAKLLEEKSFEVKIHKLPFTEVKKVEDLTGLHLLAIEELVDWMVEA